MNNLAPSTMNQSADPFRTLNRRRAVLITTLVAFALRYRRPGGGSYHGSE